MMNNIAYPIFCAVLLVGGGAGFYLWHRKKLKIVELAHAQALCALQEQNLSLEQTCQAQNSTILSLESTLKEAQNAFQILESTNAQRLEDMRQNCEARIAEEKVHSQHMLQALKEQFGKAKEEQDRAYEKNKEELTNTFKALSAEILNQNTQHFNQQQILSLQPLKEQIAFFSKQLTLNHNVSIEQNAALLTQIEQLHKLNHQISTEAQNLTNALKSENKKQGTWGEMILQKVLENSGLREGQEYELQTTLHNDESKTLRPDAVIKLPKSGGEERCVVVDSKTSLVAYERLCNAQSESERLEAQKALSASIKTHFKSLSAKNYQQFLNGQKLDFVLMFIPIEGAFLEAMHQDMNLYNEAYKEGVVLVSPTTIMAVLRIIHNLWQFEHRNANMEKIFTEIQKLFKTIAQFEEALKTLGRNIDTMDKTYKNVMTKYGGQQGIANKSERIHKLLRGAGFEEKQMLENPES